MKTKKLINLSAGMSMDNKPPLKPITNDARSYKKIKKLIKNNKKANKSNLAKML